VCAEDFYPPYCCCKQEKERSRVKEKLERYTKEGLVLLIDVLDLHLPRTGKKVKFLFLSNVVDSILWKSLVLMRWFLDLSFCTLMCSVHMYALYSEINVSKVLIPKWGFFKPTFSSLVCLNVLLSSLLFLSFSQLLLGFFLCLSFFLSLSLFVRSFVIHFLELASIMAQFSCYLLL
jgi:hypothetical protein